MPETKKHDSWIGRTGAIAQGIARDPGSSYWLKKAVAELCQRDPVDAASDAAVLNRLMDARVEEILGPEMRMMGLEK